MRGPSYRTTLAAFSLSLLVGLGILALVSDDPALTLRTFVLAPFTKSLYLGTMLDQASLILLCALGFSIAFRAGLFNLGGEGQVAVGALVAVVFALEYPGLSAPWGLIAGGIAAFLVPAMLGMLIAVLKTRMQISEVITSFLVSLAMLPLVDFFVAGPLRDPASQAMVTRAIDPTYFLMRLLPPSRLTVGAVASVGGAVLVWHILRHWRFGYDLRVIAANPDFARSQGVPLVWRLVLTLGFSAGFHGVAGATLVYGHFHAAYNGISGGIGWAGISAALLARAHPLGAILAALILGFLEAGTRAAVVYTNVSMELSGIMQGIFFLFVTLHTMRNQHG